MVKENSSLGTTKNEVTTQTTYTTILTIQRSDTNLALVSELAGIGLLENADAAPVHVLVSGVPGGDRQPVSRSLITGGRGYERRGQRGKEACMREERSKRGVYNGVQ